MLLKQVWPDEGKAASPRIEVVLITEDEVLGPAGGYRTARCNFDEALDGDLPL